MKKLYKVKQTYTLDEAAQRLSLTLGESVSDVDVLKLIGDGELAICYWHTYQPMLPAFPYAPLEQKEFIGSFRTGSTGTEPQYKTGVFRIVLEQDDDVMRWARDLALEFEPMEPLLLDGLLVQDEGGAYWELAKWDFDNKKKQFLTTHASFPNRSEIIFTKHELDRFEAQFSAGANSSSAVLDSLGDRERASLQKQVAALALLLAQKSGTFNRGDKPNVNQIADAVGELLERLPDAKTRGVGKSSIRDSIKAGLDLLTK